jgi:hypothetical protein
VTLYPDCFSFYFDYFLTVRKIYIFHIVITAFLLNVFSEVFASEDRGLLVRLDGKWKFCIGDSSKWANKEYDDSNGNWVNIKVPSPWEDQGFYGYDGYAWYRTSFITTHEILTKDLYLSLGYIDDVDQVFINGKLIGFSGTFPPNYSTSPEARRKYPIPNEYLNLQGKNVIAVRVYNHQMAGGIISGDIGIFSFNTIKPDLSLLGMWQFRTGDAKFWKNVNYRDNTWKKIAVPGNWENQGFLNYKGTAWYRKYFVVPDEFASQKLKLVIGRIDNCDEVYINGVLVGSTGRMFVDMNAYTPNDESKKLMRAYDIPENLLIAGKENIICVRVYNFQNRGGITDGPVGIMKLINFNRYFKDFIE